MIFIDAREGLSGDMLLAAMTGLLEDEMRREVSEKMTVAARAHELDFRLLGIEEGVENGYGISYVSNKPATEEVSYEQAFSTLAGFQRMIGDDSETARRILGLIFDAEADAHGRPAKEIHLHEIGRPQALLNIAGIGLLHSELTRRGAGEFMSSTITTGKGLVVVSHGAVRVPAPAARNLLKGLKHIEGDDPGERATPSGIAAVKAIAKVQSDIVPKDMIKRSIGFGTKRFGGRLGRTTLIWARGDLIPMAQAL